MTLKLHAIGIPHHIFYWLQTLTSQTQAVIYCKRRFLIARLHEGIHTELHGIASMSDRPAKTLQNSH